MTYPSNAELELLRILEILGHAVDDWPTAEVLFEGNVKRSTWTLHHPGLLGQKIRIDDVKFRAYITSQGDQRLQDFIASPAQVLESVRDELYGLVQGLGSGAGTPVSEHTVRDYHGQLHRLDRKGFAGDRYQVPSTSFRSEERKRTLDGGSHSVTLERVVPLWRFIGELTGAIRYIEFVLGELRDGSSSNDPPANSAEPSSADQPAAVGRTPAELSAPPVPVFIAYSHKDAKLRAALESHLSSMRRLGLISTWYDRMISAGEEWEDLIDENLENAGIILALISSDFIASEYCYGKELARARERHEAGEAIVIPVVLRPVDWHGQWFADLLMLPEDGRAVTLWPNRDAALAKVAKGIREAVEKLNRALDSR